MYKGYIDTDVHAQCNKLWWCVQWRTESGFINLTVGEKMNISFSRKVAPDPRHRSILSFLGTHNGPSLTGSLTIELHKQNLLYQTLVMTHCLPHFFLNLIYFLFSIGNSRLQLSKQQQQKNTLQVWDVQQ